MAFWDGRGPAKENIRLFEAAKTWRRYADEIDATTGEVKERGASRAIDGFLLNGLNATNLLLLTGAGSSFCVANRDVEAESEDGAWTYRSLERSEDRHGRGSLRQSARHHPKRDEDR